MSSGGYGMSSAGAWDGYYSGAHTGRTTYGVEGSYRVAATWLAPCPLVEDWGAGLGGFGLYRDPSTIHAIDGSSTPWVNEVVDLTTYEHMTSTGDPAVPGIHIRHVLEHNHAWPSILANACASCAHRLALTVYTPLASRTHVMARPAWDAVPDVPEYSFRLADLTQIIEAHDMTIHTQHVATDTFLACVRRGSAALFDPNPYTQDLEP